MRLASVAARAYLPTGGRIRTRSPIDILAVLRLAVIAWWRDFAPILGLGALLLTLPELVRRALGPTLTQGATLITTLQGVCAMLFLSAVIYGVLHMFARRPLSPRAFISSGLAAAQPGLVVALILGAGAVSVRIVFLIANSLDPMAAGFVDGMATAAALWALATLLPAVPAAVAERLGPIAALQRAAVLTRGNRIRLLGLVAVVGMTIVPILSVVGLLVFNRAASPADVSRIDAALTATDPGLWIGLLTDLLLAGVLACVPAAVYAALVARATPRAQP